MALWTPEELARLMEKLGESEEIASAVASAHRLLSRPGMGRRTREVLRVLADYPERSQAGNRRSADAHRRSLDWNMRQHERERS